MSLKPKDNQLVVVMMKALEKFWIPNSGFEAGIPSAVGEYPLPLDYPVATNQFSAVVFNIFAFRRRDL